MTTPAAGWYPDPASPSNVRWWDGAAWTHHVQPHPELVAPETAPAPLESALAAARVGDTAGATPQPGPALEPTDAAAETLDATETLRTEEPVDVALGPIAPVEVTDDPASDDEAPAEGPDPLSQLWVTEARSRRSLRLTEVPRQLLAGSAALLAGVASLFLPWMTSSFGSAGAFDASLPWAVTGGDIATAGVVGHGLFYVLLFALALAALSRRLPTPRIATIFSGGAITALTAVNYLRFATATGEPGAAEAGIAIGYGLYAMVVCGLGLLVAGLLTDDA